MPLAVGIDVAKELHWACILDTDSGRQLQTRKVANTPEAIDELIAEIGRLATEHGPATVGVDVLGGIAGLLTAMLLEPDHDVEIAVVHVPGLLVNRSRRATRGGERKSDPADAKVIADQLRLRAGSDELRPVARLAEPDAVLRLLVNRRRELVGDQTRRLTRLRDLLTSIHPGLEHQLDVTTKTGLWLLTRYVTPDEIRAAGREALLAHLVGAGRMRAERLQSLADGVLAAAQAQRVAVPGEALAARLVRELAEEALAVRDRLAALESEINEALDAHPDGALIRSLPGMGAVLTAEFLAEAGGIARFPTPDALASAAGLAPVLQQSGKMHYLRRPTTGNRALKRVFYQSAFCAIQRDPASKSFYQRKRAEGKRHHQALIALARRRVNVVHAMLRTRTAYRPIHKQDHTGVAA
jgi:transposase